MRDEGELSMPCFYSFMALFIASLLLAPWRFNYRFWFSFVSFVSFVVKDFGSLGVLGCARLSLADLVN
jgi:hypothetical protein